MTAKISSRTLLTTDSHYGSLNLETTTAASGDAGEARQCQGTRISVESEGVAAESSRSIKTERGTMKVRFVLKRTTLFNCIKSNRTMQVLSGQEVKAVDGYTSDGGDTVLICETSVDGECFQADVRYRDVVPAI